MAICSSTKWLFSPRKRLIARCNGKPRVFGQKSTLALLAHADNARDPIRKAKIVEARTNAKIARLKAKILEKVDGLIDCGEMQEALALLQMQPKPIEKTAAD